MPVQKVTKGKTTYYRWGNSGKMYRTKKEAEKQGRAIEASKSKKK